MEKYNGSFFLDMVKKEVNTSSKICICMHVK